MSTIFIQPIFAPDEKRFERNKNSLNSFISYVKEYNCQNVKVAFGGWARDEYWDYYKNTINDAFGSDKICLIKFDNNYGKAVIVNTIYKKAKENVSFTHFLTCDSDILFPLDTKNLFERLTELSENSVSKRNMPFGMVSLKQLGDDRHYRSVYDNSFTYKNSFGDDELVVYPHHPAGIAGGCIFTSCKAWDATGGYRHMGVYAGDDAYYLQDLHNKGFTYQMADTIGIFHPMDDDVEYATWKDANLKKCRDTNGRSYSNLDSFISDANLFWSKK